jgi:hypothetical protein
LQCLRIQGENIVLKDKLSDAISKIPDKKVSIVSLLMKSKYTDHGFGHIFDFAASHITRQDQRNFLNSMDMPVLNDDPNSHDLLRSACHLSSMAKSPSASSAPTLSNSSRLREATLSMNGLLYTSKAIQEFKSGVSSHTVKSEWAETASHEQRATSEERRPSKSMAGYLGLEQ